jgi:diacylglycerol kinase
MEKAVVANAHTEQRNFRSISILGLTCVIMCTWMGILS